MKERPILFNTSMIQALQRNAKNQTRRTTKLDVINQNPDKWNFSAFIGGYDDIPKMARFYSKGILTNEPLIYDVKCPYGQIGDILWVRETFNLAGRPDITGIKYIYKADKSTAIQQIIPWKPSIFMPREACRIKLKIGDIKIERLQDISEEDAINEGIQSFTKDGSIYKYGLDGWKWQDMPRLAKEAYKMLWIKINGLESWNKNPWVWVIKFERI